MGNNQSLPLKSDCLHLKLGVEYAHDPLHPFVVLTRHIRMVMVDKYGAHLKHLRILRFIQPPPMLNPSGCMFIPFIGQQQKVLRFSGHLISHHQLKSLRNMKAPKLSLSQAPVMARKSNSNITDVSGIDPFRINLQEVVYKMNIMQNETESAIRYFGTIGSRVSISHIGLFDEEMTVKSGDRSYRDLLLQSNTTKHILLNAIQSEKYKQTDPIISLKVSSILSYLNPDKDSIQIRISTLQQHHFYEQHSKTCVINDMNEECLFMIYSGNDHHIRIQNRNEHSHHINISFETSHKDVNPEAITVVNHHYHNTSHHTHNYYNIITSIIFALAIVLGLMGLVAIILRCYYRARKTKDDKLRLQGLLANRGSFFNQVIPSNIYDEYESDSSSI